ncbi:MAG: amidohydrolase [Ginsengibacter sp.]
MISSLITLRKELHAHPELSGSEIQTAKRIHDFLADNGADKILTQVGGNGVAAMFTFSSSGPVIVIRCEMDALPIEEINDFPHRSVNKNISHKCGHDGHMAIVAGLLFWLKEPSFKKGKVVLLFQPAEETGTGAEAILKDERFLQLNPDYIFAMHNLPGEEMHSIVQTGNVFSATVQSFALYLKGELAHASEPENGTNPALALAELIKALDKLIISDTFNPAFALLTPVYMQMGEKAYGVSAGEGELHYTIRTWTVKEMQILKDKILALTNEICAKHYLQFSIDWFDYFPAVINAEECGALIKKVSIDNGLQILPKSNPFKWGEDFGWFSQKYKTGFFGVGAGLNTPALHHNNYDFPDEIVPTGIKMFSGIIKELLA